jgi:hypothetical protein
MTHDEIIEMANKAYAIDDGKPLHPSALFHLEIFAKLVASKEREACAKVCDNKQYVHPYHDLGTLIRARGEA